MLSSDDGGFDPREFTKIKGSSGAWELTTKDPVTVGLRVKTMERVAPSSLARARKARGPRLAEPFRPSWQPYIYHPKTTTARVEPPTLTRKGGASVRPHTVFNRDDRELLFPDGYPWHCIGKVLVTARDGTKTVGTGTLVGARTVLCSGHMMKWGNTSQIQFIPGRFNSQVMPSIERAAGGRARSSFVTEVFGYNVPGRAAWDIAVLRLAEPLGEWLGTLGARPYDDDWEDDPRWTLVGYPGQWGYRTVIEPFLGLPVVIPFNEGDVPTRQFGISVEDDDSDGNALELEHRADTSEGNSGGPLFGHWPKGPYVIGVHSGQLIGDNTFGTSMINVAAGGNAMVDLVQWARATWV